MLQHISGTTLFDKKKMIMVKIEINCFLEEKVRWA